MRRKLAIAAVSLLTATLGIVAIAEPAQAAVCNSGTFCLYDFTDGTGLLWAPRVSETPRTRCNALPSPSVSNKTAYIRNRSAETLLVYDNSTCSSAAGVINPNSAGPMRSPWVDSISSWCRCN